MSAFTNAHAAIAALELAIDHRPLSQLKPDPKSARLHNKRQIKALARSITEFGFVMPILTDNEGGVITGHARLLAAQQLSLATVPTIRLDHLGEPQIAAYKIAAYKIADNRLRELSTWDHRQLAESLRD